ncbi:MAG: WRKY transcription factor, partial [Nitrospiraceae bacterium]|nr:WRKY transcription factor [Nitrospiraceae bacterium]
MLSAVITSEEVKAKMEELWKMQSALEAKIQALSAVSTSTSPTETKRQRDDSGSTSTSSSSASESADSGESKRARTGDVVPPPGKQGSAAGKAPDGRLTKEEIEKELDAYRHEDGFTFRITRPPRVVLCKEKGEKWQGLEKIERVDLCCTARNYNPSCPARRTVDRDPATGRIIEVRSIGEHIDHGRKRASRADSDVRRRAKQLVKDNARPADAEQVLVAAAEKETPPGMPIVAHRTMSQRQVSQMRQYENHKLNPYPAH